MSDDTMRTHTWEIRGPYGEVNDTLDFSAYDAAKWYVRAQYPDGATVDVREKGTEEWAHFRVTVEMVPQYTVTRVDDAGCQ